MVFRRSGLLSYMLVSMFVGGPAARAQVVDPHEVYERSCAGCHTPHAGDFARDSLQRRGDRILGRDTGEELRSLLAEGHGRLTPLEVDALVAHLSSILEREGLFREKCLICHDRAVTLARSQLIVRDGRLVGRYSGRDIGIFLESHGRLKGSEIATVVRMLERQLKTQVAD